MLTSSANESTLSVIEAIYTLCFHKTPFHILYSWKNSRDNNTLLNVVSLLRIIIRIIIISNDDNDGDNAGVTNTQTLLKYIHRAGSFILLTRCHSYWNYFYNRPFIALCCV